MQAAPAYTAVAARQTLQRSNPAPEPATAADKPVWSPDLRQYVQRAFDPSSNVAGVKSSEMQEKLKAVITWAAEGNRMASIDWDTYPMPQQLILQERAALHHAPLAGIANLDGAALDISEGVSFPGAGWESRNRKRKSSEFDTGDTELYETATPARKKNSAKIGLEDRISGKAKTQDKKQKKADAFRASVANVVSPDALERRKQRFGRISPISSAHTSRDETLAAKNVTGPVVGTCLKLEKNYFRLTSAPKPEEVRPLPVLKEMMMLLRKKWKAEHNYAYACDQFKSLRQDLTVQHVKTEFTVQVYEAHARIALEMKDLGEYNQCQTQLRALYRLKLGGRPEEFMAYRILYFIYTCNRTDMNDVLADLTKADKQMDGVRHALKVRAALAAGNYHRFFKLYQETPFMGAYLLDMCIPRQRLAALSAICKT